ncbi:MAG TPA: tetratricopeptide repeat protein [Elusimicrobiales bacterium]|mgnify:CR=1 FL=1|nr:tetratricopeptide repeat protein [Elusimicrobiales bacterium]
MKTLTVLMALWLSPARAGDLPSPAPAAEDARSAPGTYGYGMEQRLAGDHAGAKATFMNLLLREPASSGALEGLSLACIALGQYEEALVYLRQWEAASPGSPYILKLKLRAQTSAGEEEGALLTCRALAAIDPRDCVMRARAESLAGRAGAGVFPEARTSRTLSIEGLETSAPQRILYEGRSASARFRHALGGGLKLIGGAAIRREAQRNDGRGFTYYDIQEKTYSAGLARGYGSGRGWEAEYGRSFLSDIEGEGVGRREVDRLRLHGYTRLRGTSLRLWLASAPRYLRVSGGSSYFRLLRDESVRAEAEGGSGGLSWLARAGVTDTSEGTTLPAYSLRGGLESGPWYFNSVYAHAQQEFYSGSADGRLRYVNYDRLGLGLRRQEAERYRAGVSGAGTFYSDANSLGELDAELAAWLPRNAEFHAAYRFSYRDFGRDASGYDSTDEKGHWLGAYWRRCRGRNWSAMAGYEHGFLSDRLMSYDAGVYLAEFDWYAGPSGAISLQARRRTTTGRGNSFSAGLQARISFR